MSGASETRPNPGAEVGGTPNRDSGRWLVGARAQAIRYWPRFRDRRFWYVQGLVIGIAAAHFFIEKLGYFHLLGMLYFVPVSLFFVPVVYAALNFGFAGSMATALWAATLTIPNLIMWHFGLSQFGEILQLTIVIAIAYFAGERVDREVNARRRAEEAGRALKVFAAHVVRVQEDERQAIARELHDDTVQNLALLCRRLDGVENRVPPLPPAAADELHHARQEAENLVGGLRNFARTLRPPILDDLGVVASIRRLLADFSDRSGVNAQFALHGEERRLPRETELGIFRVAQETLRNVERHARASNVQVNLYYGDGKVRLDISDDGVGFDVMPTLEGYAAGGHLGLLGIQERVEILGGKLKLESRPGQGTAVTVSIPVAS